jgi:SSS family solute:Na+ symporter
MPEQSAIGLTDTIVILLYLMVIGYLGWLGYRGTRSASDYLLAGRNAHPFVMAVSYGATFISTAAIVGFGGVAGLFGMSLMWLTFLNIAIGIFIAFTVLGEPTRRIGHRLDAHTFPELLGRRYQSRAIQIIAGLLIFLFMPLYAAAVLTGGSVFAAAQFGVDFHTALLIFSLITGGYVIAGGLKAVMYTDSLQGVIMGAGMLVLLVFTYQSLGGVSAGNQFLTDMAELVPEKLQAIGHQGWTRMPEFGWGAHAYDLWWIVVSAIILGVGIGALAQPQLVVRFMTVRSRRELNRAVPIGALFILIMVAVPYIVGSLSNAWFAQHGPLLHGRVVEAIGDDANRAQVELMQRNESGHWEASISSKTGKPTVAPMIIDSRSEVIAADGSTLELVSGRSVVITYTQGQADKVMPAYITASMPRWFGLVFFMTLLSAAMSTLSSQFHALGTSAGRDVFEQLRGKRNKQPNILVVRLAIVAGLVVAVSISHTVRDEYVIARFTAIFFGLCAATFLPAYIGGLFFKGMTRAGALASMLVGLGASLFWLLLVKSREASAIGIVQWLTDGKTSILSDFPNWPVVDPVLIALPLSILTAILVSSVTRKPDARHLTQCFGETKENR